MRDRGAGRGIAWLGLGAALVVTAYLLINTTFMPYDDEGYLLISHRNYQDGKRLYDDVFSQYGPWPYVYQQAIAWVCRSPLTHLFGRGITILHWVASAILCGFLARRLTGRLAVGLATTVATFGLSWQMTSEPSHPGSHIALLVALAAAAASRLPGSDRPGRWAAVLGVLAALLCLTKINVGLLLVAGVGAFALRHTAWPAPWRRPAGLIAAAGLLALPWVLVGRELDRTGVLGLALQFTAAAAGLLWISPPARCPRLQAGKNWLFALGAGAGTLVLVCLPVIAGGTSPSSLFDAVLLSPLKLPTRFLVELNWIPAVWPVAGLSLLLTGVAGWELRGRGELTARTRSLVVAARLAGFVVFAWNAEAWLTFSGISRFAVFCLPLLPVYVLPLTSRADAGARVLAGWAAAFVALPQVLHVFPVAGSQMAWGTFLCVPLFAAGLSDAWSCLIAVRPARGRWLAPAGGALVLGVACFQLCTLASTGWLRYRDSRPLGLPGAEDVRPGGRIREALRLMTLNARVHCDLLFSRQGMFSYNLWSGVPSPTTQNATHWFWLLNDARQREIADRLAATPRNAIIVSYPLDALLARLKVPVSGPLVEFINAHYRPLIEYEGFAFLVPQASRAVPFGLVEALQDPAAAGAGRAPFLVRSNVVLDGRPAQFRLEALDAPWGTATDFVAGHAAIFAEPINRAGETVGAPVPLPSRERLRGLFRLSIFCAAAPGGSGPLSLVVRDPSGTVLSESVFATPRAGAPPTRG